MLMYTYGYTDFKGKEREREREREREDYIPVFKCLPTSAQIKTYTDVYAFRLVSCGDVLQIAKYMYHACVFSTNMAMAY